MKNKKIFLKKITISFIAAVAFLSTFRVNASREYSSVDTQVEQNERFTVTTYKKSFPKHLDVMLRFQPSDDFEIVTSLLVKQIYNLSRSSSILNIKAPLFVPNQVLSNRQRNFIHNIKIIPFIETMERFPALVSTFEGRINILVFLTEVYFRKNDITELIYISELLLSNEHILNSKKLLTIETLLFFPLTFLKNIANNHWKTHQDRQFANSIKDTYSDYIKKLFDISYKINFYKNIFFYQNLETYNPRNHDD